MRPLRILVVEDDARVASTLAGQLQSLGHDVCGVEATESDAVVSALGARPDLVIIDPWLGDGSGRTELDRQGLSDVPQLFVSSDAACVEQTHPGAVVVEKGCRESELARAIRRALGM